MNHEATPLVWRKSTFSGTGATCVELAATGDSVAVRNSNHPDAGTVHIGRGQLAALLTGVKAGELDDLT
jgi:hypothetical protein